MGLMKLKKNKKFNYKPRYYKGDGNPYELKHKFDDYRTTVNPAKGLKGKFNAAIDDYNHNRDENVNRRVLIIVGILVLLFLLIIGFDLSIFLPNS
ncbi:riboflavin synthase subunit beta [Winogradskyella sp. SYSU M77433]|uniref:riboflavin synthase subunit beta n=1 Tax=Winogradskyella sp. SYSU M77433 TaxID=3042722 RepID=UPI00248052D1|nr:riboflavin synthase subunit beta [Winogradskyella sp. SYSU M77433]MDH7912956.1 riboflavin synthase subunit beta [Winogradskyella sp. SYSU M77433]|tara:strand:+ start:1146 stop:1430 length:285 start_codon:yes stop_codon:yes gene_type:complete